MRWHKGPLYTRKNVHFTAKFQDFYYYVIYLHLVQSCMSSFYIHTTLLCPLSVLMYSKNTFYIQGRTLKMDTRREEM